MTFTFELLFTDISCIIIISFSYRKWIKCVTVTDKSHGYGKILFSNKSNWFSSIPILNLDMKREDLFSLSFEYIFLLSPNNTFFFQT